MGHSDGGSSSGQGGGRVDELAEAADLDDVMTLAATIERWTQEEEDQVAAIIRRWDPPRALYHLLLHPRLLPAAVRHDTVIRALEQRDDGYVALGGVVAVQELGELTSSQWQVIRDLLVPLLDGTPDVISGRVSSTLAIRAGPEDVEVLAPFARHENDTVRHNVLALLFRAGDTALVRNVVEQLLEDGVEDGAAAEELNHWLRDSGDTPKLYRAPLFSYLPNYPSG